MTIDLAIEYIPRRMRELGIGDNYYLRFRHFVMKAGDSLVVEADNQFFILVDEIAEISIESKFGLFDLSNPATNEQSYEHQGTITISNNAATTTHIRFIQVIPVNEN